MQINKNDKIAGVPILDMRKMFKGLQDYHVIDHNTVSSNLGVSLSEAKHVLEVLEKEGYIEKFDERYWKAALKGNALGLAKLGAGFTRKTAERKLNEFLDRVKELNQGNYAYEVVKVILFGSYLTDAERLGDVDVAIELKSKVDDLDELNKIKDERKKLAKQNGKTFNSLIDELTWPSTEVLKFLKSRCRVISLHDADDGILDLVNYKVVYAQE